MNNLSGRGVALKLGGTICFSLMYATLRLAGSIPVGQEIFFRAFFALVPVLLLAWRTIGLRATLRTSRPLMHVARSLAGVSSMFLNFTALAMLPLADLTAFGFVSPIFAVILAALVLREGVGPRRWSAVFVGLFGVLVMLAPHGGLSGLSKYGFSAGALLALSGAFLSAIVVVLIRSMHQTERGETIVFYFMSACSLVGGISMVFDHVALDWQAALWLVISGILGGLGQLGMTFSYRYAEPSLLAPFDYMSMIWAVALGWYLFAEVPNFWVMLGAAIVIASGLFIIWRERQLRQPTVVEAEPVL
ncbi:MAG: DMT family transporter [Alphaproteobacteria bacterium]|nr:DMT family transporter [Alphaproteobacteria bacterium]